MTDKDRVTQAAIDDLEKARSSIKHAVYVLRPEQSSAEPKMMEAINAINKALDEIDKGDAK